MHARVMCRVHLSAPADMHGLLSRPQTNTGGGKAHRSNMQVTEGSGLCKNIDPTHLPQAAKSSAL